MEEKQTGAFFFWGTVKEQSPLALLNELLKAVFLWVCAKDMYLSQENIHIGRPFTHRTEAVEYIKGFQYFIIVSDVWRLM